MSGRAVVGTATAEGRGRQRRTEAGVAPADAARVTDETVWRSAGPAPADAATADTNVEQLALM